MKREDFIQDIATEIILSDPRTPCTPFDHAQEQAERILHYLIENGFRLPQKQNKIVEDTLNGGTKHGPVEYGWDDLS